MRSVVSGIMCSTIALAIGQSSRGGEPANSRPAAANSLSLRTRSGGRNLIRRRLIYWWNRNFFPFPVRTG